MRSRCGWASVLRHSAACSRASRGVNFEVLAVAVIVVLLYSNISEGHDLSSGSAVFFGGRHPSWATAGGWGRSTTALQPTVGVTQDSPWLPRSDRVPVPQSWLPERLAACALQDHGSGVTRRHGCCHRGFHRPTARKGERQAGEEADPTPRHPRGWERADRVSVGVLGRRSHPVKRLVDNLLIDLIAAAVMIGMLATGYILRFPLPPGSNKELTLWGLTRHQWGDVHFWISLGLIAVILLHLCLHWQWIAISVKRKLSRRKAVPGPSLVSGLMTFLALVAGLVVFGWAAQSRVNKITAPCEGVCPPSAQEGGNKPADLDAGHGGDQRLVDVLDRLDEV